MILAFVYILSALTCAICAVLLLRRFTNSKVRMLMWCALCFVGLTVNNVLLIFDFLIIPKGDLSTLRLLVADMSVGILALGLAWEAR